MAFGTTALRADVVFEADTGRAKQGITELQQVFNRTTNQVATDSLKAQVATEKLSRTIARYGPESTQAKQATVAYRAEMDKLARSADHAGREIAQETVQVDRLDRAARRSGGGLRSFTRSLAIVSAGLIGAGGLAYGLKSVITEAVGFDRSMRNVNSIAKLSEGALDRLEQRVLRIAGPVAQAPKTLAEGLYDLESSGFSGEDSMVVLEAAAIAASAGLTTTEVAAKAVAAALNAYHLPAEAARKVSDVLFTTVDKGVITFEELAQQMGDLVPIAAPLGVTLEEVGAAMATVTLGGVPAAEAGTRVKNSMVILAKPSKDLSALLRDNGYASGEAAVAALGYAGVLDMIDKATRGNVTATAKLAPEIRALMALVGLTGKNLAVYEENLRAAEDAQEGAGHTARVFAEQQKSSDLQLRQFSSNIAAYKILIGQGLLPELNKYLQAGNEWLEQTENMERVQQGAVDVMEDLVAVARGVESGIRAIKEIVDPTIRAVGGLEDAVKLLIIALAARKVVAFARALDMIPAAAKRAAVADAAVEGIGATAVVATGRVGRLGTVLAGLSRRVGPIAFVMAALSALDEDSGVLGIGDDFGWGDLGRSGRSTPRTATPIELPVGLPYGQDTGAVALPPGIAYPGTEAAPPAPITAGMPNFSAETAEQHRSSNEAQSQARERGRVIDSLPRAVSGGPGGQAAQPTRTLSRRQQLELDLARAESAGGNAERQVLEQLVALGNRDIALHERLLRRGVGDQKKRAALIAELIRERDGYQDSIDSILKDARDKADARKKERDRNAAELAAALEKIDEDHRALVEGLNETAREIPFIVREMAAETVGQLPPSLALREQIALAEGANVKRLTRIYQAQLESTNEQLRVVRRLGLGEEKFLQAQLQRAQIKQKLRELNEKEKSGMTASEFFTQAAAEAFGFAGNIAARGEPLSTQDTRGLLGVIAGELAEIRRASQQTAQGTGALVAGRPTSITDARQRGQFLY